MELFQLINLSNDGVDYDQNFHYTYNTSETPSISNILSSEGIITIKGSNFGTKLGNYF